MKTVNKQRENKEWEADAGITRLVEKYRKEPGGLIPLLQEVQELIGYLPRGVLEQVASEMHTSLAKLLGVASFYSQFYRERQGKNMIRVCTGTACHVRGGAKIFDAFKETLGVEEGGTTENTDFTLSTVACVGACSLAPVVMVNEDTHGRLTPDQLDFILEQYRDKKE